MSKPNYPLRFAINELTFALTELETHWDSMEGLLRAYLEEVKARPTDPRILNGDCTREELGIDGDVSYVEHEINALIKNRDLIRQKHALLRAEVSKEVEANLPVDPNSIFSCCPGEHTFGKGCLATSPCSDPSCPEKQKVCDRCRPAAAEIDVAVAPFEWLRVIQNSDRAKRLPKLEEEEAARAQLASLKKRFPNG